MNTLGRGITLLLVGILIFILPLQYLSEDHETIAHSHVSESTSEFTELMLNEGYLTSEMYNDFINEIDATGELYDVEIEVAHQIIGSETSSNKNYNGNIYMVGKSISELATKQKKTNRNDSYVKVSSHNSYTGSLLGGKNLGINKDTTSNYSIADLNKKYTVLSTATHVHTSDCYVGHNHAASGCVKTGLYTGYTWNSVFYDIGNAYITTSTLKCNQCGTVLINIVEYDGSYNSTSITINSSFTGGETIHSSASNMESSTSPNSYYNWPYTRFCNTLNFDDLPSGFEYKGCYNCGDGWSCGYTGPEDTTPICNQVVKSIIPTNPTQTVNQGENIITTATATYLDGHIGVVNCTSNYSGNVGTQVVTLTYSGLVNNAKTTGTKTCSITVTTKSNALPISLSVNPSSYTVKNGLEPTYTVTVNYSNNTSKVVTSYSKTGFTKGAGTKNVTFTYTENGVTVSKTITITVKRNTKVCPYGHVYELDDFNVDHGCPYCEGIIKYINVTPSSVVLSKGEDLASHITVIATYLDGHTHTVTDWTSNYNPNKLGDQLVEIRYSGCTAFVAVTIKNKLVCDICGTEYDALPDGSDPGCPVCSKLIVHIEVSPYNITVAKGSSFETTVIATYQDGHKEEVTDWTSNFDSNLEGKQTVTIFYANCTTNITVTVVSDLITCPICGTEYSWKEHPNGCPICSETVESIEAYLKNGSSSVSIGSEIYLNVILNFKDGHKELATSGWTVEGYEPSQLGDQTLIVRYGELFTYLDIVVINNLEKKICPNGHVYYLNDDGSDPGCPYCDEVDLDTGAKFIEMIFTEDILQELDQNGMIQFESGDYITVKVIPRNISKNKVKIISTLFRLESKETNVICGGRIT